MSKRQLIYDVFDGKETDRIPVGFWKHFIPMKDFLSQGLDNPSIIERSIEGHLKFIDEADPDFVKVMTEGFFIPPQLQKLELLEVAELEDIEPLPENHPWIEEQIKAAKRIVEAAGDRAVFWNVFSPTMLLQMVALAKGIPGNRTIDFLAENPELTGKALAILAEDAKTLSKRVISEAHVDGIYLCARNYDTKEVYRKFIAPFEKEILNAANEAGNHNILHICGYSGNTNDLTIYEDYASQAVNWAVTVEDISLGAGRKYFGEKVVIGGFSNVAGTLLDSGTKEEIEAYTTKLLEESGITKVIIGADCAVPDETEIERLGWVRDAAVIHRSK